MKQKINIAIDGHSSCGKGTLAKHLASSLDYKFIDSGAMYRAVTLYLMQNNIALDEVEQDPALLGNIKISFDYNSESHFFETTLNGKNVEHLIRGLDVAKEVSKVSAISEVRRFLVAQQRLMGKDKGVVMDGRDIGTVVFPDAELKIFMTASSRVRAKRRYDELRENGVDVNFEEILHNIQERDFIDSNRDDSPLTKAADAITLDNSAMSREEQARLALSWARGVINALS